MTRARTLKRIDEVQEQFRKAQSGEIPLDPAELAQLRRKLQFLEDHLCFSDFGDEDGEVKIINTNP